MTRSTWVLAALLLSWGCANRAGKSTAAAAEDPPRWSTTKGRYDTQIALAESLIELNQPREALALLSTMRQEVSQPDLAVDVLQARATLALGMPGEAAAILEPWQERSPRDADFHALLGLVYFDQQRSDDAQAAFERAVKLDATHFDALNNLGFLHLTAGRPEPAIEQLRAALALRPNDARARNNLGFALAASGDETQALEVFSAVNPRPAALANMGLAAERRGDPEAAKGWYRQVLELDPGHAATITALERLDTASPGVNEP